MPVDTPGSGRTKLRADQIAGGVILALGIYVAWASREYPFGTLAEPGAAFVPFVLAIIFAAFGLVLALSGSVRVEERKVSFDDLPHALIILAALSAAAFGIERIGYRTLVIVLLLFFLVLIERRNVFVSLAVAGVMSFGTFYLINNVLRVPLPLGPWGF